MRDLEAPEVPPFVIKRLPFDAMSEKERQSAMREVALLSSLRHPSIVEYYGSFIQDDALHIMMEYCDGGDLGSRIKSARTAGEGGSPKYFDEAQVMSWFAQLVRNCIFLVSGFGICMLLLVSMCLEGRRSGQQKFDQRG